MVQAMVVDGHDLWIGCEHGTLYIGGFLASSLDSFQKLRVPGLPAILGLVGVDYHEALLGAMYAYGTSGTIHAVSTLVRNVMGTADTHIADVR